MRLDVGRRRWESPRVEAERRGQPDANARERIDARSQRALMVPLLRFLDASLDRLPDEGWGIRFSPGANALNAVDALHGGVIATVLDVAAYLAVLPHLDAGEEAITVAFAAQYVAAAEPGDQLDVRGSFTRRTRGLAFAGAQLRDGTRLLASAMVTKAIRSSF